MKTYLVTGCAGFIGSNFVHYMLEKYEDIRLVNLDKLTYAGNLENLQDIEDDARHIFVQGDICDKALVTDLIAKYDPDYVINFAAESHVDRSIKNPEIFVESNVLGTVNLLQCCKDAWYDAAAKTWKEGKKYLQVSTDEVYGALGAEGYFMETTPLCPHSPYSASKASADMFVKAFHDTYGMPMNITRCSNNYGPYQFPEKLIPLLINNAKQHKTLPVYGDGMQIRDWLYVMDHCKAIDMVANGGKDGEVYNVGGHNERPNIFIVKTVIAQLHDRLKDEGISEELITHVADRLGHDRRYGIDPTKIKDDLGWYPETPFEKGIVLTIDWYLDHEEWRIRSTSPAATTCRGRAPPPLPLGHTGSALIPALEIDTYISNLLGPDYQVTEGTFSTAEFVYQYDEEKQAYLVPVTSSVALYTPTVEKITKKDGQRIVTVGYVPTSSNNATGELSLTAPTEPTKYMDYVFTRGENRQWYLTALRDSDMQVEVTPIPAPTDAVVDNMQNEEMGTSDAASTEPAPVPEEGAEVAPDAENLDDTGDAPAEDAAAEG